MIILMEDKIILSHRKGIRILATIYLIFIILGDIILFIQLLSNDRQIRYFDALAILSGSLLSIMFIMHFLDAWKVIIVNEKDIKKAIFLSCRLLATWDEVIRIEEARTNLFKNFAQGIIVKLITVQGKKIEISKEYENFNFFYEKFIKSKSSSYVCNSDNLQIKNRGQVQ